MNEEEKTEPFEKTQRWEKFVHDKNTSGIIIPLSDDTKKQELHIKPDGSIPSIYNSNNVPNYRLMSRRDRRR